MNKILVTGFEPFGGEAINPSWELAKLFHDQEIKEYQIICKQLPTVFYEASTLLKQYINEYDPQIVISLGQAGGSDTIRIEQIAVNKNHATSPDNKGNHPQDEKIYEDGPDDYYTTLPAHMIVDELTKNKIPASISLSAGTYVCNHVFYHMIDEISAKNIIGGFVHIPYLPEQVENKKDTFSMSLNELQTALDIIIRNCIDHFNINNS